MRKKRRIAYGRCFGALLVLTLLIFLVCAGVRGCRIYQVYNSEFVGVVPDPETYPLCGVDVSCYQGNVDWNVIASQNISFAFIKATEGSSYCDPNFRQNWEGVFQTGIYAGAYHFFSFESEGKTQAQNFIAVVGDLPENALPPVVDVELYGEYNDNPASKTEVRKHLRDMLDALEEYYGVKPIIYAPEKTYFNYIFGAGFGGYPLWIANTRMEPLPDWDFWQYTNEGKLEGYDGMKDMDTEGTIDLNVYRGDLEKFLKEFVREE